MIGSIDQEDLDDMSPLRTQSDVSSIPSQKSSYQRRNQLLSKRTLDTDNNNNDGNIRIHHQTIFGTPDLSYLHKDQNYYDSISNNCMDNNVADVIIATKESREEPPVEDNTEQSVKQAMDIWNEEAPLIEVKLPDEDDITPEKEEGAEQPKQKLSTTRLLFYAGFLLFSGVGNNIFFKKMTDHLPNYPYFLNQMTSFVYIPVFWSIVLYTMKYTKYITPEMRKSPKFKFFVMGALDNLAGIFMLFGGVFTSGSTQQLLTQAVIPSTMVLAYAFLKERYAKLQYVGALVIVAGVLIMLIPQALTPSKDATTNLILFNIIFLMNAIPQAMSSVYKEVAFTEDLDINYVQAWVATWQVIFGFALAPVNSLKFLGENYQPLDQIPNVLWNGMRCLAGINSIVAHCGGPKNPCDNCQGAYIPVIVYLIFNMLYNVSIMLVIKHAGANLLYFVLTLRVPLVQLAFALSFIQDPPDTFHWYSYVATVVILGGLIIYRYASSVAASSRPLTIKKLSADGYEIEEKAHLVAPIMALASEIPFIPLAPVSKESEALLQKRRDPQRIRSGLYGRLGIRSPALTHLRDSFYPRPSI